MLLPAAQAPTDMQSAILRSGCRASTGAFRRIVCQAGSRGKGPALPPPPAALRRAFMHRSGAGMGGAAAASGSKNSLAAMFRRLREQRLSFRTFSSGGGGGSGGGGSGGGGGGGGGGDGSGGSGGGLWAAYLALLDKRPLSTKAITAALLNGLGDVIAQTQFQSEPFDWKRLGIFTGLGLVLIGPTLHLWYGSLGNIVKAGGNSGAIMRLALDQLCFAPVFISTIVSAIMALEGHAAEAPARLRRDLPDMLKSNWLLWVPFQFINFRFVPPQLQVLMANIVALVWNTYVSYKSHA